MQKLKIIFLLCCVCLSNCSDCLDCDSISKGAYCSEVQISKIEMTNEQILQLEPFSPAIFEVCLYSYALAGMGQWTTLVQSADMNAIFGATVWYSTKNQKPEYSESYGYPECEFGGAFITSGEELNLFPNVLCGLDNPCEMSGRITTSTDNPMLRCAEASLAVFGVRNILYLDSMPTGSVKLEISEHYAGAGTDAILPKYIWFNDYSRSPESQ